jgi:hypothetical protein
MFFFNTLGDLDKKENAILLKKSHTKNIDEVLWGQELSSRVKRAVLSNKIKTSYIEIY